MKKAKELFAKRAKQYGDVDLAQGPYGEWLSPLTRRAWFFWYSAWKDRAKDIKGRRASPTEPAARPGE